ncbi:MAG: SDR family NAD(P)-dependent oxidoreductase [Myxococcota bacterium]
MTQNPTLGGHVALVTGASRGIGRALVPALLDAGASKVYATARDTAKVADLAGERVVPLALDVTDLSSIAAAARRAEDVTLLLNNAGSLRSYDVLGASRADLEADLAVNFFGPLEVTKAFRAALAAAEQGVLVNVLTLVSLASMAGIGGYAASKAAALSLTQSLRATLRAEGTRVVGVYPGAVDTDMIRGFEMAKATPESVAAALVQGVAAGAVDIFPDAMSEPLGALWQKDPKALEARFASM